ncbi:putative Zn(2)-C6 fungal-type domain-containing protein [Seiridium cardinale]
MPLTGEKRAASHATVDAKRSRVSLACVGCRRKKERCDGFQPVCGPCRNQNRQCCYTPRPKKRGLPAGYVRALEILLGLMFHSVDGSQGSALALLQGKIRVLTTDVDESPSIITYFAEAWRKSPVAKELEGMLASMDVDEDDVISARDLHDRLETIMSDTLVFGRSEDLEDAETQALGPLLSNDTNTASTPGQPDHTDPPLAQTSIQQIVPLTEHSSSLVTIPRDWPRLVDVYYTSTHCWFPMIPKHDTLRVAYSLSAITSHSSKDLAPGDPAFLWAILAYTSYQDCMVPNLDQREYEHKSRLHSELLQQASTLTMESAVAYGIGHVQALLILTLLYLGQGLLSKAWVMIGRAVYLIVDLTGTAMQHTTVAAPLDMKTHRVYLGCFVLDTIIGSRLGRRPYLRRDDFERVGLLQVDGIEEWEVWNRPAATGNSMVQVETHHAPVPARCISTFNNWVKLVATLNDACHLRQTAVAEHAFEKMTRDLVPPDHFLALKQSSLQTVPTTPHTSNLDLTYASIYLTLRKKNVAWSKHARLPAGQDSCVSIREQVAPILKKIVVDGITCMLPLLDIYLHSMTVDTIEPRQFQHSDVATGSESDAVIQSVHKEFHRLWHKPDFSTTISSSGDPLPTDLTEVMDSSTRLGMHHSSNSYSTQVRESMTTSVPQPANYGTIVTDADMYPTGGAIVETPGNELYSTLASLDTADWYGLTLD